MVGRMTRLGMIVVLSAVLIGAVGADRRRQIYDLGLELEKAASYLAGSSFDQFRGWEGRISDQVQAVLFKSEAFAASCRLFLRLAREDSDYYRSSDLRTNLYSAFAYLARSFDELEREMQRAGVMPYALRDSRRLLERMESEFAQWPSVDNLAYLHQKYVKARDATVWMIERKSTGVYVRRAFKDLESLFRYNYDLGRGKDPWEHLVEVPYETLERMEEGPMVHLNFEGFMIMEMTDRPNRSVYLIEGGKKRGITSANLVQRYGGWNRVYEVPIEVINKYPEGEPIR